MFESNGRTTSTVHLYGLYQILFFSSAYTPNFFRSPSPILSDNCYCKISFINRFHPFTIIQSLSNLLSLLSGAERILSFG